MNEEDINYINESLQGVEGYMDNSGREYRYQADWSLGQQMFHVRCDSWEDFIQAKRNIETLLPMQHKEPTASFPEDSGPVAHTEQPVVNIPTCGIHNTPMKWVPGGISKTSGKQYPGFWSCKTLGPNGEYCTYHLYKKV